MEIVDDLTAVARRIRQICEAASPEEVFGAMVRQRVEAEAAPTTPVPSRNIEAMIRREGARYGVDPALLEAIVNNESGFDPAATSPAGAQGLMQLMPSTATSLGVADAYDPQQNVAGGARYLRGLLDRFHRVELAVAAYNAGPGAVARYGRIPPFAETQAYVRAVLAEYRLRRLQDGNVRTNAGSQPDGSIVK